MSRMSVERSMKEVKSPCIDVCEFHQDICLGCGRSKAQIRVWKKLDNPARRAVLAEADMNLIVLAAQGLRRYPR
jgi:predicted Fe-S protein YdhL (DUF1289 family)